MAFSLSHFIVVCGHYGAGKTNLSLNLARWLRQTGEPVTIVDLDIVNPYFRSSDYRELLAKEGIRVIASGGAGTTLDIPALPAEMYAAVENPQGWVVVDVGGDDAGAAALGRFSAMIAELPSYDMLYVVNRNRVLTQSAQEAAQVLFEIEHACRLKATAIVNNSHLSNQTTLEDILDSESFAREVSDQTGRPLLFTAIPSFVGEVPDKGLTDPFVVDILVKSPWEI